MPRRQKQENNSSFFMYLTTVSTPRYFSCLSTLPKMAAWHINLSPPAFFRTLGKPVSWSQLLYQLMMPHGRQFHLFAFLFLTSHLIQNDRHKMCPLLPRGLPTTIHWNVWTKRILEPSFCRSAKEWNPSERTGVPPTRQKLSGLWWVLLTQWWYYFSDG